MKHTPGLWGLRGYQIRAEGGVGAHVATYQICQADGELIASAPALVAERDELREQLEGVLAVTIDLALEHMDRGLDGRIGGAGTDRDCQAMESIERLRDAGQLWAAWASFMAWRAS